MTHEELAGKYFSPFRIDGNEIIPELCPFCFGGQKHDKKTFAMNLQTGAYNCKRGSCGAQGSFTQLLEHFGEKRRDFDQPKKHYKLPTTQIKPAPKPVEEYLMKRGFSKKTWEKYGLGDDGKGDIAIPHYEGGKIVLMKFRHPYKPKDGEQKEWRESGGKPVFFGMQFTDTGEPLTITEGQMDTLALVEAGIQNVVSVPSGCEDLTCVDLCWDWLNQFKRVVLWVDSDEPGQELERKLIQRLGAWRCYVVKSGRKDANEVLLFDGKNAVYSTWSHCHEVPQAGLIRLADVETFDFSKAVRVCSGIRQIDKVLGGFYLGQTTILTGKSTAGKSTLLGQILLNAVEQEFAVCAYSGELPAPIFRYWIDLQAAGPDHVNTVFDNYRNDTVTKISPEIAKSIREWYYNKFFLYDSFNAPTETSIFEAFEYAARRHGCKIFMVDNLMTLMLDAASDGDWWAQQRKIINKLCNFARVFNIHMLVVAHPKKVKGNAEREDVSGVAELTNRVDNVLIFRRLSDKEKEDVGNNGCDAILTVDKNRMFGKQNDDTGLIFDDKCKRFSMPSDLTPKAYGWGGD
jgi:twinkle protein